MSNDANLTGNRTQSTSASERLGNALPQRSVTRLADGARLHRLADDVACLQLSLVNVYLIRLNQAAQPQWVLVDAGLANSAATIRNAARHWLGVDAPPQAIVLTHGHFDHVDALPELLQTWDVPVYAHPLEAPYLTGRASYPPPDPGVGGGSMSLLSWLLPRGPINIQQHLQLLASDGSIPELPQWRWIATPGHTPGHVSLWRSDDRLLIAGDAAVTVQQESLSGVLLQYQKVWRPPAYYTTDWPAAHASVRRLADLIPETLATGHGVPMRGPEMRRQLNELAEHWERYAPWFGRYVSQPAVSDETGVRFLPPPVVTPQLLALAGLGVGIFLSLLLSRRRR